ncbi:S-adenosyl-L-methionine-dependent methyltransferase, partial [Zopfia rhizophila CBS 207.26]
RPYYPSFKPTRNGSIQLPDIEESSYTVHELFTIKMSDTVELKEVSKNPPDQLHSGDLLRIKHIIRNVETDTVRPRGYRLRRTNYHGQLFDWKLNELVMVLHVDEDDPRPPIVQGMDEIPVEEALRKREVTITNKSYPLLSFREQPLFTQFQNPHQLKEHVFHFGRLVCRWVNIAVFNVYGKIYSGEVRSIYPGESDHIFKPSGGARQLGGGSSRETFIYIDVDEDIMMDDSQADLVELLAFEVKKAKYTFADCFCGAGGASRGADNAGLSVTWSLDKDQRAMEAYRANFPGAREYMMDAHNILTPEMSKKSLRVGILHLSPPCCYWSPAQKNDQANFDSIYTVGPILAKLKPRVATLEQTFGLATHSEHRKSFRLLINDIISRSGYSLRYKIEDLSEHGLPQRRKCLLIIAARRGNPLPPFPTPTHGPAESRLKRFTSVWDALKPLRTAGPHLYDPYHPHNALKAQCRKRYDPKCNFLRGCITGTGGDNCHYDGRRKYTVRECSLFQTFPQKHVFRGTQIDAMLQVGSAFPPVMATALFEQCITTLEAFDAGLIGPEDDFSYLDDLFDCDGNLKLKSPPDTTFSRIQRSDH